MARKYKPEDIIGKLGEAEIVPAQGGRLQMRVSRLESPSRLTTVPTDCADIDITY